MKIRFRFIRNSAVLVSLLLTPGVCAMAQENSENPAKKSGWLLLNTEQHTQVSAFCEDYKSYLSTARSAQASTRETLRLAGRAGFVAFKEPSQVKPGARLIFNGRDRALILAVIGTEPLVSGSHLVATHHDSPHINLKARPVMSAGEFALFKTTIYGGIKKYQWGNIPLALVGRIDTTDGRQIDVSVGTKPEDPVLVIPDNAPHSDADLRTRTYTTVFSGEEMTPVVGSEPGDKTSVASEILHLLSTQYKIKSEDLVSAELELVPAVQPRDVGLDRALVGAYGQDDRVSSYCAIRSLLDTKGTPRFSDIAYLSNFEEVGSVNNTGAASQFLNSTLAELVHAQRGGEYNELDLRHALHNARVISADANDGINPIFPYTSEASNAARLSYGVAIKLYGAGFNANSEMIAWTRAILDQNSIPWQTQTPKAGAGGGTIGGYLSAQDMEVIDLGIPLLSMHAPFEMASKVDVWNFYRFMRAFYQQ